MLPEETEWAGTVEAGWNHVIGGGVSLLSAAMENRSDIHKLGYPMLHGGSYEAE